VETQTAFVEQEAYQDDEDHRKRIFACDAYRLMVLSVNGGEGTVVGFQIYKSDRDLSMMGSAVGASEEIINCHLDLGDGSWKIGHSMTPAAMPFGWTVDGEFISAFKERAVTLEKSLAEFIVVQLESLRVS
jgi:hypothetical protein